MSDPIDTLEAEPERPILARYEPGFRRFYAQGSLIHNGGSDPETLRIAFWSERTELELEDERKGVGYALEGEAVMTWAAAKRLHALIDTWLKEKRPPTGDRDP